MNNLVDLYCVVDDFCHQIIPELEKIMLTGLNKKRTKISRLSSAEIMTILIYFHCSHYRDFKTYYLQHVAVHLRSEFPSLVSYTRFVELMPSVFVLLYLFIHFQKKERTGIYFIDSTILSVCYHKRASSNRVFKGLAQKSKSTMGWVFGFKLHLVINDQGEILAFKMTTANTDDRKHVDYLTQSLKGKMVGDKGYISAELFDRLFQRGLQLITKIKKNMKNKVMVMMDKILLRKRALVETVIDQLKNVSQIEHSRHRSPLNFVVNIVASLAAYSLQPKKPSLKMNKNFAIAL